MILKFKKLNIVILFNLSTFVSKLENMIKYDKTVREKGENSLRQTQLIMLEIMNVIDSICKKHNINYWLDAGTLLGAVRHKGFIPWDDDLDIALMRDDYNKLLPILKKELPDDLFLQTRETDKSVWKYAKVRDNYSTIVQKSEINKNIKYHQGVFIDIFPFDYCSKDITFRKNILNRRFNFGKNPLAKIGSWIVNMLSTIIVKTVGFNNLRTFFIRTKSKKYITTGIDMYLAYDLFDSNVIFPTKQIKFEEFSFNAPNDSHKYLEIEFGDYMKIPDEKERVMHAHELLPFTPCNHPKTMKY